MDVVVTGAGVAGLASALSLCRAGHKVTLVERDPLDATGESENAFDWTRKGIAHFLQPHAFLPRGRRELIQLFPDVYRALLEAGASDYSIVDKIQGRRVPEDQELVYLSVRRPVIEWALRKAVQREPNIRIRAGTRVADVVIDPGNPPIVRGIVTDQGEIRADLIVDASGRTTCFPAKLIAAGCEIPSETSNTHIVYYSRYFSMLPGKNFPRGPWLTTPRGDLGYAGFSSFTGDSRTFALVFAVGSWDRELRVLQHEAAWDAAAAAMPMLAPLVDPSFATPITPVLAMGELQNTLRHYVHNGRPRVRGMVPVGDTLCHTDPTFALGLSFSLFHARALRDAIATTTAPDEILSHFWNTVFPETRERYDFAVAADDARAQMWQGEKLDPFHARGSYPLFTMIATAIASLQNDDILRMTVRRIGFLDRLTVLDDDPALQRRIEAIVDALMKTHRVKKPIARSELLKITEKARASSTVG